MANYRALVFLNYSIYVSLCLFTLVPTISWRALSNNLVLETTSSLTKKKISPSSGGLPAAAAAAAAAARRVTE